MATAKRNKEEQTRHEKGLAVLKELGWGDGAAIMEVDPDFFELSVGTLFGGVWSRPGLSLRDRELITIAAMIALDRQDGVKPHFRNAHAVGITDVEIKEIIFQMMFNGGWSVGVHALKGLKQVRAEQAAEAAARKKTAKGRKAR